MKIMENAIVLYKSSTGFSQKYAEWIAEELSCKALSIKDIIINELINFKTISIKQKINKIYNK